MKPSKTPVYLEIKESSLHVLESGEGAEFPIEREAAGRISAASMALLKNGLRGFLQRHGMGAPPQYAICALPARGVTVRTISLPASAKDDPRRLLAMQIEAQFPVPPSELAWGFSQIEAAQNGTTDYLVAAVKREAVAEYNALLADCGLAARFCVAALVRAAALPVKPPFSHLEIGLEKSELISVDESSRGSLRVLNWGKGQLSEVDALRRLLPENLGALLSVSSAHLSVEPLVAELKKSIHAEAAPVPAGPGLTTATHGLQSLEARGGSLLFLGPQPESAPKFAAPNRWKWPVAAAALLLLAVSLRYAEAMFFQSQVSAKLAELNKYRGTLPKVEKELGFLNYIKTNQPPYLDTIAILSSAAPSGTRLDQVSIVRRGEVSFRGSVNNPQGPEQFRSKLIDSGFFSKVVVEEQGPAGRDRNKVNFRMSAILKPESERKVLPPEPPNTNKTSQAHFPPGSARGGTPPHSFPPGMRPGLPPGVIPPGALPPGALPPHMQ